MHEASTFAPLVHELTASIASYKFALSSLERMRGTYKSDAFAVPPPEAERQKQRAAAKLLGETYAHVAQVEDRQRRGFVLLPRERCSQARAPPSQHQHAEHAKWPRQHSA